MSTLFLHGRLELLDGLPSLLGFANFSGNDIGFKLGLFVTFFQGLVLLPEFFQLVDLILVAIRLKFGECPNRVLQHLFFQDFHIAIHLVVFILFLTQHN